MEQKQKSRRIRLTVAYDGTNYHGWQVQPDGETIEGVLNRCLGELLEEPVEVIGASRTDSGVHALGNVAVFDTFSPIPAEKFSYALNRRLPEDIRIQESREVPSDWHPRHVPCHKTYEYRISRGAFPNPVRRLYTLFTYHELDVERMNRAAAYLEGEHDFCSFCQTGAQVESTVRTIDRAVVYEDGGDVVVRITGNGFLYNMVRIIVGTLMEAGQGKRCPEDIPGILEGKDRRLAGPTVPARGLTLMGYEYDVTSPFPAGTLGSSRFRIPALLYTRENTVLAACDIRWNHGQDSAGNLETAVARSRDGGRTWERQVVNYFDDVEDGSDRCIFSAGFIDPVIAQDRQGILYLLTDLCPAFVGAFAVEGMVCGQDREGRHPNGRLALKELGSFCQAEPLTLNAETYPYYVGEPGPDGYAPVLRLADESPLENYLLDEEYYLYRRTEDGVQAVMISQLDRKGAPGEKKIQANIFYAASPLKAYPAFHIVLRTSRDDGRTWSRLRIISDQIGARGFTAVCPGRGYSYFYQGKERVIIPVYDNNLHTEYTSVIFTEDQGRTWVRGERASQTGMLDNGLMVKSSESQLAEMPDGSLRIFSRNIIDRITWADSRDGGMSWNPYRREEQLKYCGNCMISVINYSGKVDGKPALIASYPEGDGELYHRVNGVIVVGLVEENGEICWKYRCQVTRGEFLYSCLAEVENGDIAILYEGENVELFYRVYTIKELCKIIKI